VVTERTRLTGEDRRSAILLAGRRSFARKGFHGTSTADLAVAAGCSEPTLYKYFPSKQALFAAVLDDATMCMGARVAELIQGETDPVACSLTQLAERAATDALVIEVVRLRMLAVSLSDDDEIRAALERSSRAMREGMIARLATSRARGRVREDIDLETLAWLWLGMTLASGFAYAVDPTEARELVPEMARAFVTMVRPATEPQES
jgi:TetR/AcrR family transcriptional regulator, repressor for uid operon